MSESCSILLAEDEMTDAYFVEWAFKKASLSHRICRVQDGQEAIEYLSGEGMYKDRDRYPIPALLLLDLKMPRLDGFEVLRWLREQPHWGHLPTVILSSSHYPADMERAKQLGAADFHVKPGNPQLLVQLAREIDSRWLQKCAKHQPSNGT